jgi:hypothetical protein
MNAGLAKPIPYFLVYSKAAIDALDACCSAGSIGARGPRVNGHDNATISRNRRSR